ncbi:hypothetical protein QC764_0009120 [Podospora pseudoanserina]|uniref:Uncharacterized protein n=1 Tax=Podospora pseudoanserina TaxID=2609844 RepID=A0ABR0IM97_9PEZI|nr:hypothetical protein QC764_0009120 [Podospora pseudoanserina]
MVGEDGVEGVHAHTDGSYPCAATASKSLNHCQWIYVPTPSGDKITACREVVLGYHTALLFRRELSGIGWVGGLFCLRYNSHQTYMVNEHSIMPTALVLHLKMNRDGSYQKPSALSVLFRVIVTLGSVNQAPYHRCAHAMLT